MEEILKLQKEFERVKSIGYVKSVNNSYSGIGLTFEKLIGVSNNNFEIPDFNGIEIKTKRKYSKSFITLFNSIPDGSNLFEIKRLQENYGYPDKILKQCKVLNGDVVANKKLNIGLKYKFELKVDRQSQKVFLNVYNNNELIDNNSYWSFQILEEKLNRKLKILALISAWPTTKNNDIYYKYTNMEIYTLKSFSNFIDLIENGTIKVVFKIGVFRSGNRIGQIHDHGSGFAIREEDLLKLYELYS